MTTGIIYGSSGGITEDIARRIKKVLGGETKLMDISYMNTEKFNAYDRLIIGTSTWGSGDLQDDWENNLAEYKGMDFSNKTFAFFGTGDQEGFGEYFLNAMGTLHNIAKAKGATIVGGEWSALEYDFEDSIALDENDNFVGLAIDEDNQSELSDERIEKWVEMIRPHFS